MFYAKNAAVLQFRRVVKTVLTDATVVIFFACDR
jgi:hypothetical protein